MKKRPRIARPDQVRISRDGEDAIIEFLDSAVATTHLRIGPQVRQMTDEDILLLFNQVIAAQIRDRDELGEYVAVEVPAGSPQVQHHPESVNEWSPRGGVLRCLIEDGGGEDGDLPVVRVDDQEFSWEEFGRMLLTYAGWGMRVVFVPDDELEQTPKTVVREPERRTTMKLGTDVRNAISWFAHALIAGDLVARALAYLPRGPRTVRPHPQADTLLTCTMPDVAAEVRRTWWTGRLDQDLATAGNHGIRVVANRHGKLKVTFVFATMGETVTPKMSGQQFGAAD